MEETAEMVATEEMVNGGNANDNGGVGGLGGSGGTSNGAPVATALTASLRWG